MGTDKEVSMWILAIHYAQGRTIHEYSTFELAVGAFIAWQARRNWMDEPPEVRLITLRRIP